VRESPDAMLGLFEEDAALDQGEFYQLMRREYSDSKGKFTFRHFK